MSKKRGKVIFTAAYAAYMFTYILRINLSMAKPSMSASGVLSLPQFALMGSVFSAVYALGRLLNGIIGDHVKPRTMIVCGLCAAGTANLLVSFFPPYPAMLILWGINAYAQSMLWSSLLRLFVAVYPEAEAKKKTARMGTSITLGNVVGILLSSVLLSRIGAFAAFLVPGLLVLLIGGVCFITFRGVEVPSVASQPGRRKGLGFSKIFKDAIPFTIPMIAQAVIKDNISLFMADYFLTQFGTDPSDNPLYVLFIPLVGLAGRTMYPVIYKLLRDNEHSVSTVSFLVCALFCAPLCFALRLAPVATVCLSLLYALSSVINTSFLCVFPVRFASAGTVSSVSGLLDLIAYSGHALSSALYAVLIPVFGYRGMYFTWVVLAALAFVNMVIVQRREKQVSSAA